MDDRGREFWGRVMALLPIGSDGRSFPVKLWRDDLLFGSLRNGMHV
jgi:hypothetical protein